MIVNLATRPGDPAQPNLDWCGATPTCAVVLDGVSEPAGTETGCRHGTYWYVQQLGSTLLRYASVTNLPLVDILGHAIEDVRREHAGKCDLDHPGSPAATVVMMRQRGPELDFYVLSDSTLVMDLDDGLRVVTDPRADAVVTGERQAVFRHPVGSPEHAESLARMVDVQRQFRNREGGYWVAAALPEAARHGQFGTVLSDACGSAIAMSDGVSRLHEWGIYSLDEMLAVARTQGPNSLIDSVRHVEQNGPPGIQPEYKTSDDATVALVVPTLEYPRHTLRR